ncbi:MAG: sulfatase-like hydrolase/transferase [Chitinivibrionales bacterium]|nr:sulfatase-like hydrolase/transferase [Chitinivibrionales bacterium]
MKKPQPNILIITTDQQRKDSLGCYGSDFAVTPTLDALARGGILFNRAYAANPVCSPSRVSLFTGQQVSRHGCWNIGVNTPEDTITLAHRLAHAGYATQYVGKIHFQAFHSPPELSKEHCMVPGNGWRKEIADAVEQKEALFSGPYYGFDTIEWASGHGNYGLTGHYGKWVRSQVSRKEFESYLYMKRLSESEFGGEANEWGIPKQLHNSVWTANRAIDYINKQKMESPFFLAVGFEDPHHPHALPEGYPLPVDPKKVPLPDFAARELDDKPDYFKQAHYGKANYLGDPSKKFDNRLMGQILGFDYSTVGEDDARLGRATYYSMVSLIDEQLGRIVDCLKSNNMLDNTIIIITSDHGELLGDHGLWLKGPFHYEQLLNVPLVIHWPKRLQKGRKSSALCSLVDIAPTILAATGVEYEQKSVDGIDQMPVLEGKKESVRDSVLSECVDNEYHIRLKSVITRDSKLTRHIEEKHGELYDLANDPMEKKNLWNDTASQKEKASLMCRLVDYTESIEREKRGIRTGPA